MSVCSSCDLESKYYVGDIGTDIIVNVCSDITGATLVSLKIEKPDGTLADWVGSVYDSNYIKYTVVDGDFDQVGKYALQAYVEIDSWSGRGDTTYFKVSPVFG